MKATLFDMEPLSDGGLQLNDAQRRAVSHGQGPLLVIAGAGTGKTRVITERIRHLLESNPELTGANILGLTFTKKAAGEMRARVIKACGDRAKDVVVATFHSFCETLLKEVQPNRQALEEVDHWILLRRNMSRLKLERYRKLAEPGLALLGVGNDFVMRLEIILDVHAQVFRRQILDMPDRGHHDVVLAEVFIDRFRLGGRFDDD